jgi:hypothetical protein
MWISSVISGFPASHSLEFTRNEPSEYFLWMLFEMVGQMDCRRIRENVLASTAETRPGIFLRFDGARCLSPPCKSISVSFPAPPPGHRIRQGAAQLLGPPSSSDTEGARIPMVPQLRLVGNLNRAGRCGHAAGSTFSAPAIAQDCKTACSHVSLLLCRGSVFLWCPVSQPCISTIHTSAGRSCHQSKSRANFTHHQSRPRTWHRQATTARRPSG